MTREPIGTAGLREAVKAVAAGVGEAGHVPHVGPLDPTVFRAFARGGVPFIIVGLVEHWALAQLMPNKLREHFGAKRVKARHGDYVKEAFTARRSIAEMSLAGYLDEMDAPGTGLSAYLGNQPL